MSEKVPQPIKNPDFQEVQVLCEEFIETLGMKKDVDDDFSIWVFEKAMKAVYGERIFDWINEQR